MNWKPISTFENDGKPVDLWVADDSLEGGGQRFPDMTYRDGGAGERNDWDGDMICLSDCGYTPDDVTHWMRVTAPAERPSGTRGFVIAADAHVETLREIKWFIDANLPAEKSLADSLEDATDDLKRIADEERLVAQSE